MTTEALALAVLVSGLVGLTALAVGIVALVLAGVCRRQGRDEACTTTTRGEDE